MLYRQINLMAPTYKRSNTKLPEYISSILNTVSDKKNVCLTFAVNHNDIETQRYLSKISDLDIDVIIEYTTEPNLAFYFNLMYERTRFNDPSILVSMLGDDMIFKTHGWDSIILNRMNEKNGKLLIYCNDNFCQFNNLCVNMFVTRDLVEALKPLPFMCENYKADWIDVIWMNIGKRLKILDYHPEIIIEHNHELRKRNFNDMDETYKRLRSVALIHVDSGSVKSYVDQCVQNIRKNGWM